MGLSVHVHSCVDKTESEFISVRQHAFCPVVSTSGQYLQDSSSERGAVRLTTGRTWFLEIDMLYSG